jgi:hypothetical protein
MKNIVNNALDKTLELVINLSIKRLERNLLRLDEKIKKLESRSEDLEARIQEFEVKD